MQADDFLRLAKSLRDLGAVAVRAGDLEVTFGPSVPSLVLADPEEPSESPREAFRQYLRDHFGSAV